MDTQQREEPPTLRAEHAEGGGLKVWCPYCFRSKRGKRGTFHYHGNGDGHRVAHCDNPASPYNRTGYILKEGTT